MALLSKPGGVIGSLSGSIVGGIAVGIVGGALLFGLAGCGGGGGGGFKSSASGSGPLVGTWTRTALTVEGASVSCPNNLTINTVVVDTCVAGETITFGNDGTYTRTFPALRFGHLFEEIGTYTLSGSTLTLTRTATGEDADGSGTITSTEMTAITSQTVPNSVTIDSTSSFTLTPQVPAAGSNYTVAQSLDGTPVTSTFTR